MYVVKWRRRVVVDGVEGAYGMVGKGERAAELVHVRCLSGKRGRRRGFFLSPILWCIFAVAKGFTERKDLLGTPFSLLIFLGFFSSDTCQESRNQRQAGIMPAHRWKCRSRKEKVSHSNAPFN